MIFFKSNFNFLNLKSKGFKISEILFLMIFSLIREFVAKKVKNFN